mmetsp:Transcript_73775/g.225627  ORF Transcript_73775/g.225627 Transcript_73775/m.225627 type:complete len:177 (+) Transcript_73775:914-1444(+)
MNACTLLTFKIQSANTATLECFRTTPAEGRLFGKNLPEAERPRPSPKLTALPSKPWLGEACGKQTGSYARWLLSDCVPKQSRSDSPTSVSLSADCFLLLNEKGTLSTCFFLSFVDLIRSLNGLGAVSVERESRESFAESDEDFREFARMWFLEGDDDDFLESALEWCLVAFRASVA